MAVDKWRDIFLITTVIFLIVSGRGRVLPRAAGKLPEPCSDAPVSRAGVFDES